MTLQSKAVIVWIDDYFHSDKFRSNSSKYNWNQLFGKLSSRVYRLLDIKTKFISTANEALIFIDNSNIINSDTYYYFIVDRNLPYDIGDNECDTASEDIIHSLIELKSTSNNVNFDFTMLSSSSSDTYSIKGIDFQNKPKNKEFQLPIELRHKILINIKNNIGLIDLKTSINNLNIFSNNSNLVKDDLTELFPFVGQYKSFVELQEVESATFDTLIILAKKSISDNFIIQSIDIALQDIKKNYDLTSYASYKNYNQLLNSNILITLQEPNNIPIIRLDEFDTESFDKLYAHLKYQFKVIVVDEDDENINDYLNKLKKIKIVKVDGIAKNDSEISKEIVFTLLNNRLNTAIDIKSAYLYNRYPQLLLHPILYNMITDFSIVAEDLDDPSEIIKEIDNYFEKLNISEEIKSNNIQNSKPIQYDIKYIYSRANSIYDRNYNQFIVNTIKYWLSNSWNSHHNILITEDKKAIWQKESFRLLSELFKEVKIDSIENIDDKNDFQLIKESINSFSLDKEVLLATKIQWPHEKYPMPIYMLNKLHDDNNKKLYIQDKDLSFIEDSIELENNFKTLDNKLAYYRYIFELISDTKNYLPEEIQNFICSISKRIQSNKSIFIDTNSNIVENDKEDFQKLANILLRIIINFGTLITKDLKLSELSYQKNPQQPFSEDKAGLGMLVGDIRDKIYSKHKSIFKDNRFDLECSSYINSEEHIEFMKAYNKIFNNDIKQIFFNYKNNESNFKMTGTLGSIDNTVIITENYKDKNIEYKINGEYKERDIVNYNKKLKKDKQENLVKYIFKDKDTAYRNKIYRNNNIDFISQISNLSSYLSQHEHSLKIKKHKSAYKLLSFLADTRNTWAHGDDKAWNKELFIESFIYSYESIWLMQKYILENIYDEKNMPITKYVKLNECKIVENAKENFLNDFPSANDYNKYFSKLYNKDI